MSFKKVLIRVSFFLLFFFNFSLSVSAYDGICGTANGHTFPYTATSFSPYTMCQQGTANGGGFPAPGKTSSWTCLGGGTPAGSNDSCSASRELPPYECIINSDCNDGNGCTSDSCLANECLNVNMSYGTTCSSGICNGSGSCISYPSLGDSCGSAPYTTTPDKCIGLNVSCLHSYAYNPTCQCDDNPTTGWYSDCSDDGDCECNVGAGEDCKLVCKTWDISRTSCLAYYPKDDPVHPGYCCTTCGGGGSCTVGSTCLDGRNPADICIPDSCLDINSCGYIDGTKNCTTPTPTPPLYSCTGLFPANAVKCLDDDMDLTSNLSWRRVSRESSCSSRKCQYYICNPSTWTPATNTVCAGVEFTQTSNCDTTRPAVGTMVGVCLPPTTCGPGVCGLQPGVGTCPGMTCPSMNCSCNSGNWIEK